ncbi:MAG: HAD-IA family hydrolase [Gemmatimonadetes bacterium]|nr:HAD-IA family hydrolase [Gemmatimonadota bacterium]
MTPPVRGVLLDAGNTLVFPDPVRIRRVLVEHGAEDSTELFRDAEREARLALSLATGERATGHEDQFWRDYFTTLFRLTGVPPGSIDRVGEALKALHATDHLWSHVAGGTEEALVAVREAGYRLGVVSNADGRVEALLEDRGLASLVEFVLDSHVVGVSKPDPRIFRMGVERLGLPADEVLYVGDLYAVDVLGARAAGLRTVLLDPFGVLGRWKVDRIPSVLDLPGYLERLEGGRGAEAS